MENKPQFNEEKPQFNEEKHFLFVTVNYHGEMKKKYYTLRNVSRALDSMIKNTRDKDKLFNLQGFMCWAEEAEPGDIRSLQSDWQEGLVFCMIDPDKTNWKLSDSRS